MTGPPYASACREMPASAVRRISPLVPERVQVRDGVPGKGGPRRKWKVRVARSGDELVVPWLWFGGVTKPVEGISSR